MILKTLPEQHHITSSPQQQHDTMTQPLPTVNFNGTYLIASIGYLFLLHQMQPRLNRKEKKKNQQVFLFTQLKALILCSCKNV